MNWRWRGPIVKRLALEPASHLDQSWARSLDRTGDESTC